MNRAAAVLAALYFAVHVTVLGMPAPAPVLLAFAAVLCGVCRLCWAASGWRLEWRAAT